VTTERFGAILSQHETPIFVNLPENEKFVTLKLYGQGAIQRSIGKGKTPKPFTGYRVKHGQFIYSRIDARNGAFGIVPVELEGAVVSKDFPVFDIDETRIDPLYLLAYVKAPFLSREIQQLSFGATNRQRVKEDTFLNLALRLPSLDEQRRIATILDKTDELRIKRRQSLALLDVLVQAIFEGVARSSSTKISIQEMIDSKLLLVHKDGNHGSNYPRNDEFVSSGVPFISAKNIDSTGFLDTTDVPRLGEARARSLRHGWLKTGDVLLSHNASVGKVAIYRGNFPSALVGTSLTVFRPDPEKVCPNFLASALRSGDFQAQLKENMAQTTRNQVPITAQRRLTVNIPSVRLQQAFAGQVSVIDHAKTAQSAQLAQFNSLFASLQHRAFRGEL
jgi:type I restriction enzyme S subunit